MKVVEIIPLDRQRLYGAMVKKQAEIGKRRAGAFHHTGVKKRNKARWKHAKFAGWIDLERGQAEVVTAKINSVDWQLLAAFVGWVDRHFGKQVLAVNIQFSRP